MQPVNTQAIRYDFLTILFHWLIALLVLEQFVGGLTIDLFPRGPLRVNAISVHILLGGALAALMVLSLLYQRSGVLLLSLLADDAAAGAYSAAARVLEALKILPAAFFGAMFPIMVQGRGDSDAQRAFGRAFAALMVLVILLSTATGAAAGPLLALLFGPGYEAAVTPLRVMVWSLPATLLAFRLSFELVVAGRDRAAAASMGLTLLVGGGLTAGLIGRWSLTGAAVGLVAGELAQVVVLLALRRLSRPAVAGATR